MSTTAVVNFFFKAYLLAQQSCGQNFHIICVCCVRLKLYARANTPKLRMASTSHLFLVLACVVKPTKMGREASCLFYVSDVMTALVTSYYGRQSIAKLTAQLYFMIIAWLLIALSHTFQSV